MIFFFVFWRGYITNQCPVKYYLLDYKYPAIATSSFYGYSTEAYSHRILPKLFNSILFNWIGWLVG